MMQVRSTHTVHSAADEMRFYCSHRRTCERLERLNNVAVVVSVAAWRAHAPLSEKAAEACFSARCVTTGRRSFIGASADAHNTQAHEWESFHKYTVEAETLMRDEARHTRHRLLFIRQSCAQGKRTVNLTELNWLGLKRKRALCSCFWRWRWRSRHYILCITLCLFLLLILGDDSFAAANAN